MKKKWITFLGIGSIITVILLNLSVVCNSKTGDFELKILKNIARADAEGPEVTITCSSGDSGRCYALDWTWCEGDSFFYYYCLWTGYQSDGCSKIIAVICNKIVP